MSEDLFAEKLAWFKQNEKPEAVLLVADNQELTKIAVAWTNVKVSPAQKMTPLTGDSESEVWEWLWKKQGIRGQSFWTRSAYPYRRRALRAS